MNPHRRPEEGDAVRWVGHDPVVPFGTPGEVIADEGNYLWVSWGPYGKQSQAWPWELAITGRHTRG